MIFIAVALFAALNFAVSNINRGGSDDITDEVAGLAASEIIQTATAFKNAVRQARIDGCSDTEISFESAFLSGYTNTNNPPDDCKIFDRSANGITYAEPQADWLDSTFSSNAVYGQWYFAQGVCVENIGSGGSACASDSAKDLIAFLPFIKASICRVLDERLDIIPNKGTPPTETGDAWRSTADRFVGSYSGGDIMLDQDGLLSGCFQGSGGNTPPNGSYSFFQVLMSR